MPTRDDHDYASHYRDCFRLALGFSDKGIVSVLGSALRRRSAPSSRDRSDARIDAYTDILMERGMCSSVRDWHKKPAGDELPDIPDIPW